MNQTLICMTKYLSISRVNNKEFQNRFSPKLGNKKENCHSIITIYYENYQIRPQTHAELKRNEPIAFRAFKDLLILAELVNK